MSYKENVERYRLQLWRNLQRQGSNYPHRGTPARMTYLYKLMDYARRADKNYNDAFTGKFHEDDLLLGYAGKRLKDKMRENKDASHHRKISKIRRTVLRNTIHYMVLRDRLMYNRFVPVSPIEEVTLFDISQVVFIRNRKCGEVRVREGHGLERVYQWVVDKDKTEADVIAAWMPLMVSRSNAAGEVKVTSLFAAPRLRRKPDNGTE